MFSSDKEFAAFLLDIDAIKLSPKKPFTWASGWRSPIYTDNRKTLAYPAVRSYVTKELLRLVEEHFSNATAVAGVATGAIAQGALVAAALDLPFCYVRPKPKDHGLGNMIEGTLAKGSQVVVVEDLISTGASSLKAVEALRAEGYEVIGMIASYTYGFDIAEEAFREAGIELYTITTYETTMQVAAEKGYIKIEDIELLRCWRETPSTWMQE